MPKILFVTTIYKAIQAFLLPYAKHFRQRGWVVDAMTQGVAKESELHECFDEILDVQWSRNPFDLKNLLISLILTGKKVVSRKYDLIHVHTPIAAFITRISLLLFKGRPKIIYTAHGFHFYKGGNYMKNIVFIALEKLAGFATDFLVVINNEDFEAAKRYKIVPEDRVVYMPGIGLDLNKYHKDRVTEAQINEIRSKLSISKNEVVLLIVAEFTKNKRNEDVILAFSKIIKKYTDVHLVIIGKGKNFNKVVKYAKDIGVSNKVHFLGRRSDVPVLIRSSIAVILASRREGLPRILMESLALETPCIATNIRGSNEVVRDGCGMLYQSGDVDELVQCIEYILKNPIEAAMMGSNGRARVNEYAIEGLIKRHEELYLKVID